MQNQALISPYLLSSVTFVYGFAALLYIVSWIFRKDTPGKAATWVAFAGLMGNTAGIIARWIESYKLGMGHAPLSNMYESLVFFAWTLMVIYLIIERTYKFRVIGAFATPIAFLAMAYASFSPDQINPLIPALKSNWLIAHVFTCFLGYAGFAIAFGIGIMYLLKRGESDNGTGLFSKFPKLPIIEELNHQMVMFGLFFLTIGIITGAVWANSAWGKYWSWDSKEIWSLITWFIYAALVHVRLMVKWRGRWVAYMSILGFMAVLFTYFGVNYLLPGLHSYSQ